MKELTVYKNSKLGLPLINYEKKITAKVFKK